MRKGCVINLFARGFAGEKLECLVRGNHSFTENGKPGKPFFRAQHVGSLLRPVILKDARDRLEGDYHAQVRGSGRFPQLESLENECILSAIRLQEEVGLSVVTDSEFRRRPWFVDGLRWLRF